MQAHTTQNLDPLRHSTAHILAAAVSELFPETKLAIGPAIKDGFYYDFDRPEPFTEDDLKSIEAKMSQMVQEAQDFKQRPVSKEEARRYFQEKTQPYKLEILEGLRDGEITFVENGKFVDLCRGGHLHNTQEVGAFKLLSVAGAYWRGSENNPMLQRIYGTAFFDPKDLEKYLKRLEEAEKRDHRKLGKQLDLFSFHSEAPGMPFFHPKGLRIYEALVQYWLEEHREAGYEMIKTPLLLKEQLWKASGHYEHYKENMYFSKVDEGMYAVKPMNCPGSTLVYRTVQRSYRELPLRLAELGQVHRHERSGVLHGLFRVNAFTIDDAHIFCTEDQIEPEISACIALILKIYKTFGFTEVQIGLSTRPEESMGSDEIWDKSVRALQTALEHNKILYTIHEGGGAFYGPKIDFEILDSLAREWQCGTIQLDFQMPERFDLGYISKDNHVKRPVMIHRAVFGSIERFYGILVEHFGGAFPLWLAPVQVRILTISEKHVLRGQEVLRLLVERGFRAEADFSDEKINKKIREAELEKIPYVFVIGDREVETRQVSVRKRGRLDLGPQDLDSMLKGLAQEAIHKV